jgi:hypothetical protein
MKRLVRVMVVAGVLAASVLGPHALDVAGAAAVPAAASTAAGAASASAPAKAHPSVASGVWVRHGELVNAAGQQVQLAGVNRSGTEYACAEGWGLFDGPNTEASIKVMLSWHIDVVRVPLNEDCWLGINGVKPQYGGRNYQHAIEAWVALLRSNGLLVDLDLHWTAPGDTLALAQEPMADADHSITFWSQVAKVFRNDHGVLFELFNEPFGISWSCWENGCTIPASGSQPAWQAAGMSQLLHAVRATGATNVVLLGGLQYSADLQGWQQYAPHDPTGQLAAAWHIYSYGWCQSTYCWNTQEAAISGVPVVVTEFGETDCRDDYIDQLMPFLDSHDTSYLAWTWDTWPGCSGPSLLTTYDGATNGTFGSYVRDHLQARFPAPTAGTDLARPLVVSS